MSVLHSVLSRLRGDPGNATLRRADAARDIKQWDEAASLYRAYLDDYPEDGSIWIQLGHAAKEADDLASAEAAYRQAASLLPDEPDPLLHLAHLLKRVEKPQEAASVFKRLFALSPRQEVIGELAALGHASEAIEMSRRAAAAFSVTGTFLEIEDVLNYLEHHSTVTGITRVVLNLLQYLFQELKPGEADNINLVYHSTGTGELFLMSKAAVQRLVHSALWSKPDEATLRSLVVDTRRTARPVVLRSGDIYFMPGAFWAAGENSTLLPRLRLSGVRTGAYLYDLIPITHAHYCELGLTQAFTVSFAETQPLLSFVLTISAFVAEQVTSFANRHHLPALPATPVPLAHELGFDPSTPGKRLPAMEATRLEVLDGRRYILCVCTIEARKNHIYLVNIFQRLIEDGIDVPDLVFVGRVGWRITDLMSQIEGSRYLGGKLHILHGVSDDELSTLYDRCMFTVFPSFVEGWGLPAGESLAHGKLCVASSTTSIPEVGGDLNLYVDPFNLASGYDTIHRLITDPVFLSQRERLIKEKFVARTWTDVGKQFFEKLALARDEIAIPDAASLPAPAIAPGELLSVRDLQSTVIRKPDYVANPLRLLFSEGWRVIEATGTWMDAPVSKLRFRSPFDAGTGVTVLLRLSASPWVNERNILRINVGTDAGRNSSVSASKQLRPSTFFWFRQTGLVDANGVITVRFAVSGNIVADPGSIPVGVRVHGVGYYKSDDISSRLDLLDNVIMVEL